MSLLTAAASTDKVACGDAASVRNLDPFTALFWVRVENFTGWGTGLHELLSKGLRVQVFLRDNGTLCCWRQRATTQTKYETAAGVVTAGSWLFLAATYRSAASAGQVCNLYTGGLTAAAAEVGSYAVQTDGAGTNTDDTGSVLEVGALSAFGNFNGAVRHAAAAYVARELSPGEIIDWQFRPRVVPDTRLLLHLGYAGTGTQPDWSGNGNAGTVTGATVADHVPLGPAFGCDLDWAPWAAAAAGGDAVPVCWSQYRRRFAA